MMDKDKTVRTKEDWEKLYDELHDENGKKKVWIAGSGPLPDWLKEGLDKEKYGQEKIL